MQKDSQRHLSENGDNSDSKSHYENVHGIPTSLYKTIRHQSIPLSRWRSSGPQNSRNLKHRAHSITYELV